MGFIAGTRIVITLAILAAALVLTVSRSFVWQDEITLWTDVIRNNPENARAYITVGLAYSRLEQFGKALEYYKVAMRLNPESLSLHKNLGLFFLNPGVRDLDRSIWEFELVLSRKPDDAEARRMLKYALQLQKSGSGQ